MTRPAAYLQQARQCVARAELAQNRQARLVLLQMAQAWTHMAEHTAEIGDLVEKAQKEGLLPKKSEMN